MQTESKGVERPELIDALNSNIYKILFEKQDGTLRKMRCTRMTEYIPLDKRPKTQTDTGDQTKPVAAFDLDLKEWRSIRPSSVISMEIV